MALFLTLIPVCFFMTDTLCALTAAVFGETPVILPFSAAVSVALCICLWFLFRKIKKSDCIICLIAAVPIGICVADIINANGIISAVGGGVLISAYIMCILKYILQSKIKKPPKQIVIFAAVMTVIANICAFLYARSCEYIYYWDNAIYWTFARDIANGSISESFFPLLYDSLLTFDYNYLAALPPAFAAYLFGPSRTVYIFALANFFFVPCAVSVYAFSKDTLRAAVTLLCIPMLLSLTLVGFVDVAGFAVCMVCYIIYKNGGSPKRAFAIGALLTLNILIRRWYAFFAVSFIFAMAADCIISKRSIKNVIIAAANVGFILIMFFRPLVTDKLLADYSALYAGYKFSLITDIRLTARYFGAVVIIAALCGAVYCIKKGDRRVCMPVIQAAVCYILFVRTQTHGQQHLLLYAPALAVTIMYILSKMSNRAVYILLAVGISVTTNTLVERKQPQSLSEIDHIALLPDFSMKGRRREDAQEILKLKKALDSKYKGSVFGVNVSSSVINADILKNVQPSLGERDESNIKWLELPCVDSRDTNMGAFYTVDYILSSTPVQLHLGEDRQRVVIAADECLKNKTAFGASYALCDTYTLGDIEIEIYKRERDVSGKEMAEFENMLSLKAQI